MPAKVSHAGDGQQGVRQRDKQSRMPGQLAHCHPSHFSISAGVLHRRQGASRELRVAGRENGSSTTNCMSFQESLIPCDMCHCLQICGEPGLFSTLLHCAERLPVACLSTSLLVLHRFKWQQILFSSLWLSSYSIYRIQSDPGRRIHDKKLQFTPELCK